jgi:hypothetical protein
MIDGGSPIPLIANEAAQNSIATLENSTAQKLVENIN